MANCNTLRCNAISAGKLDAAYTLLVRRITIRRVHVRPAIVHGCLLITLSGRRISAERSVDRMRAAADSIVMRFP